MKNSKLWLAFLIVLTMMLAACQPAAPAQEPAAEATAVPAEEPAAEAPAAEAPGHRRTSNRSACRSIRRRRRTAHDLVR